MNNTTFSTDIGTAFSKISAFKAVQYQVKPVPKLRQADFTMAYFLDIPAYLVGTYCFSNQFQQKYVSSFYERQFLV